VPTPPLDVVPRLTTERLVLRGFDARDFEAYAAMMADAEVVRYLGDGRPLSRAEAWRQMAMLAGHWTLRGFGLWAVEERATGALVGRVGCWEPEGWPGFELGYVLARPFWGRGYATEAGGSALRFARETLGRQRIISLIQPANSASIRVAERLGAVHDGVVDLDGRAVSVHAYATGSNATRA
jgi:RimJ/RimL family protein N-acetyltransferase